MFLFNTDIMFVVLNLIELFFLNFNINAFIILGFGGRGGGNNRGAGQQQRGGPNKFRGK